jgi:uncharacterized repeat protein (TIGR01451 family)
VLAFVAAAVAVMAIGASRASATGNPCADTAAGGGHHVTTCTPPDIKIVKTGPLSVRFGETATYLVVVKNVGTSPVPSGAIHVTDPAATTAELVFARVVTGDSDTLLEPGDVWEYVIPGPDKRPMTLRPTTCDPLVNTARVAPLKHEKYLNNNVSTATTKVICVPDLGIAKAADKSTYTPGEKIVYTVTVTNVGPLAVPFLAIAVSDPTLAGLTLVGAAPGMLGPGQTLTYTATRVATLADCGTISNTASVALTEFARHAPPVVLREENLTNNSAEATVAVVCTPGLGITKSADAQSYEPGQTITYTVVVRNSGESAIPFDQIKVSDPAVPSLMLVGVAPATLAPGATLTFAGTRVTSAADCGPVGNTATVTVAGQPSLTKSAAVTVTVAGVGCRPPELNTTLQIKKSGPTSARARSQVRHTMTVVNTGFVTAKNVVVTDPVPSGMSVVTRPVGASFVDGSLRWELGDLGPGERRVVSVVLRTTFRGTGTRCNVAEASAGNAPAVTSRLCTRFAAVAGVTFTPPRVTG